MKSSVTVEASGGVDIEACRRQQPLYHAVVITLHSYMQNIHTGVVRLSMIRVLKTERSIQVIFTSNRVWAMSLLQKWQEAF